MLDASIFARACFYIFFITSSLHASMKTLFLQTLTLGLAGLLGGCAEHIIPLVEPVPHSALRQQVQSVTWQQASGRAVEIAAGQNGRAWVLGTALQAGSGYPVYASSGVGNTSWTYLPSPAAVKIFAPGKAIDSTVAPDEPWIIGTDGVPYRYSGGTWNSFSTISQATPPPFPIIDMAYLVDPTDAHYSLFVLRNDAVSGGHSLYQRQGNRWVNLNKGLKKIVWDTNDVLLGIDTSGTIWTYTISTATWSLDAGLAVDIAVNHSSTPPYAGTVGVLGVALASGGGGYEIFLADGPLTSSWLWSMQPAGAIRIAEGENARFWIIKNDNTIWRSF